MYQVYIFGMGYVGLTLGIFVSSKVSRVFGIENNLSSIERIKNNDLTIVDKGIERSLSKVLTSGKLTLHDTISALPKGENNIYIITPGTPLDENGNAQLESIESIAKELKEIVKEGDMVLLRSTVTVGTTNNIVARILQDTGVSISFCPERTIEGVALEELSYLPQIIGSNTERDYNLAKDFFKYIGVDVLERVTVEEAELSKLLCNCERDLNFALGNEIGLICENLGISAKNVINASTENYPRSNLKKPGLVGGPCLEKDPFILMQSLKNMDLTLFSKSRVVNESIIQHAAERMTANINENLEAVKISILGCAFKGSPPTADVRGSLIYKITDTLKIHLPNAYFEYHDYLADQVNEQDQNLNASDDLQDVISSSNLIILQNNNPLYAQQNWSDLLSTAADDCLIYDFWSQLNPKEFINSNYISFGEG